MAQVPGLPNVYMGGGGRPGEYATDILWTVTINEWSLSSPDADFRRRADYEDDLRDGIIWITQPAQTQLIYGPTLTSLYCPGVNPEVGPRFKRVHVHFIHETWHEGEWDPRSIAQFATYIRVMLKEYLGLRYEPYVNGQYLKDSSSAKNYANKESHPIFNLLSDDPIARGPFDRRPAPSREPYDGPPLAEILHQDLLDDEAYAP